MIDINKKYRTRSGLAVTLYRTDAKGEYPVHGCVTMSDGTDETCAWTLEGLFNGML